MKTTRSILMAAVLSLVAGPPLFAQTAHDSTTLASAMSATANTMTVASATSFAVGEMVVVNAEAMRVNTITGTAISVSRGQAGTRAMGHQNGDQVWVGPNERFASSIPKGTCTAANDMAYVPHIVMPDARWFECEGGVWMELFPRDPVRVREFTVRDNFDRPTNVMQADGTDKPLADAEVGIVFGSPLGTISYRIEQASTISAWTVIDGYLDISGDLVANDGTELLLGNGTDPTLHQLFEAGTTGYCVAAAIQLADVSGTDNLQLGFRQNEAYADAAAYTGYTVWNSVGLAASAGAIISSQEVSEATDTDDPGVTWADATTRALKVCVSKAGVPTAYYSAAYTTSQVFNDYPAYNAITMTETGGTLTAGTGMVPFLTFVHDTAVAEATWVHWIEVTRLP